jgi:dTDP-4-amino-4,6-dideoxygalactose transaminase
VAVANGTDAIALALRALGIERGDRVVLPAVSAYPTTVGVVQAQATPAFVDVGPDGLIDPDAVESVLQQDSSVRAVVAVHLYGNCADVETLQAICSRRGQAVLVEDAAQAHGSARNGKRAGSVGRAATWSFYPTKNLGAMGDGGAVTCASTDVAERLMRLRNYGQTNRYEHVELGFNSRLDPLQAALLRVKMKSLGAENERRRDIAARYDGAMKGLGSLAQAISPPPGCEPNRHLYPVLAGSERLREQLQAHMRAAEVETLIHYPIAMPDQAASDSAWSGGRSFPRARSICSRVLSLTIHTDQKDHEVAQVLEAILTWPDHI